MWNHAVASRLMTLALVYERQCPYCKQPLRVVSPVQLDSDSGKRLIFQYSECPACGWWKVYRILQGENPRTAGIEGYSAAIGALAELDLTDVSLPLGEVRKYLLAKADAVFSIPPKLMEDVVGSVFDGLGWKARVTAYSGDDGIDVILDGPGGETIGIQVKRFAKHLKIEAEQIRSLAGALMLGGHTKGIFVTTSSYRSGAPKTAERFGAVGYPIELYDCARFLDALGIREVRAGSVASQEELNRRVLLPGAHVGSGIEAPLTLDEVLIDRPVAAQVFTWDEWIDLAGG